MLSEHDQVGKNFVTLVLKVVLSEPHRVEPELIRSARPIHKVFVALNDCIVVISTVRGRYCWISGIWHGDSAKKVCINAHVGTLVHRLSIQFMDVVNYLLTTHQTLRAW
jgi:hypothetical protein